MMWDEHGVAKTLILFCILAVLGIGGCGFFLGHAAANFSCHYKLVRVK